MTDEPGPSPVTKSWIERRDSVRAAAAADRTQAQAERLEKEREIRRSYHNPSAFLAGLVIVVGLLIVGWLIVSEMRCDPFYSDDGLKRRGACWWRNALASESIFQRFSMHSATFD